MKNLLYLIFLLSGVAYAFETYLFRVQIDEIRTRPIVDSLFLQKGGKGTSNPFYGTHVLTQPDTNYVLVKLTPQDDSGNDEARIMFRIPNVDFYQSYLLEDTAGLNLITDNSRQFPVDYDWSLVRISCPTSESEIK